MSLPDDGAPVCPSPEAAITPSSSAAARELKLLSTYRLTCDFFLSSMTGIQKDGSSTPCSRSVMHNGVKGARHQSTHEDSFLPSDNHSGADNKHVVKSIKVAGDTFDCVDILRQESLSHPLLKDHILQRHPSSYPENIFHEEKISTLHSNLEYINCPRGTVPIQRKLKNGDSLNLLSRIGEHCDQNDQLTHYMVERSTTLGVYFGGRAAMNIYQTPGVDPGQYTYSGMLLSDNSNVTNNRISVGWAVEPAAYQDSQPRLTIIWAASNVRCVNLQCPGFVQVSSTVPLGAPFANVSVYGGPQYHVTMTVFKDRETHVWWLVLGDEGKSREPVGYWPNKLFTTLVELARYIRVGAHVGTPAGVPSPPMGSGHNASEGYGKAAYFGMFKTVNGSNTLVDPRAWFTESQVIGKCYELGPLSYNEDGASFFYGGPGFCR